MTLIFLVRNFFFFFQLKSVYLRFNFINIRLSKKSKKKNQMSQAISLKCFISVVFDFHLSIDSLIESRNIWQFFRLNTVYRTRFESCKFRPEFDKILTFQSEV